MECVTPSCYLSFLLAKVIQLASKTCLLLFYRSQCHQQQRPKPRDFMGNLRVHDLLINCIQTDRMEVQRYQFRLLSPLFLPHMKIKTCETTVNVALPTKTVLLFSVEDASPLGKNEELSVTVASLVLLLQNLKNCEWHQDCSKTVSHWYNHMLFLSLLQILY